LKSAVRLKVRTLRKKLLKDLWISLWKNSANALMAAVLLPLRHVLHIQRQVFAQVNVTPAASCHAPKLAFNYLFDN
jgi:hypothetical protein